jgi:hypothetical protein
MSHEETSDITAYERYRNARMTENAVFGGRLIETIVYTIYGVRLADDTLHNIDALEEDPGHCLNNGSPGIFRAGAYGKHMPFLAISCSRVVPGEYVFHSGEKPNASKFERDRWNDDLRDTADRLGLDIVEGPGWFTIPSED